MTSSRRGDDELGALRQVAVDVPRTAPGVAFFHLPRVQASLERILYIWGIRWVGAVVLHDAEGLGGACLAAVLCSSERILYAWGTRRVAALDCPMPACLASGWW